MGLSSGTMMAAALCGAVLQLTLVTVIAYRMGYRGKWLAAPWLLTIAFNIFQHIGIYSAARQGGVEFDGVEILIKSLASSAAESIGVMQLILAIRGLQKNTPKLTEVSHA